MSYWYEPKKEDIEIGEDEINIYLGNDESGSIYATVKIKDIQDLIANYIRK